LFGKQAQQPAQQAQQPAKQPQQPRLNPFDTVTMRSPDGKQTMNVSRDQVEHYQSKGAKVVYKVGDPVVQRGQTFKVTSVDKQGNVTGAQ
jgi:hypothetical protein